MPNTFRVPPPLKLKDAYAQTYYLLKELKVTDNDMNVSALEQRLGVTIVTQTQRSSPNRCGKLLTTLCCCCLRGRFDHKVTLRILNTDSTVFAYGRTPEHAMYRACYEAYMQWCRPE
jgi:hypothetical protein